MVREIHILLTYTCTFSCDHCFWYSGPDAEGTFTLSDLDRVFREIARIKPVERVYFEGGEPFLFYPLLLEGVRMARTAGLKTGIVTNAYWATSPEDAATWLAPLQQMGISEVSVSDDAFHNDGKDDKKTASAVDACRKLGIQAGTIRVEKPSVNISPNIESRIESSSTGSCVMFRGRAVETMTGGMPKMPWHSFTRCPHEDLENPDRIHIDPYGNTHLCQGLSIGNVRRDHLSDLVRNYIPSAHPICAPLIKGGPAHLARFWSVKHEGEYVDACHFCHCLRLSLMERFPEFLAPAQVYGHR